MLDCHLRYKCQVLVSNQSEVIHIFETDAWILDTFYVFRLKCPLNSQACVRLFRYVTLINCVDRNHVEVHWSMLASAVRFACMSSILKMCGYWCTCYSYKVSLTQTCILIICVDDIILVQNY